MSTATAEDLLLRESFRAAVLQRQDDGSLRLVESPTDGDSVFDSDGCASVALVRPCIGRGPAGVGNGPGRRIYTPAMLSEHASVFEGWNSWNNHDSPIARKARMGLPRPPTDLAGTIVESSWDPGFATPEDGKYGYQPGGVVARFKPATAFIEDLFRRVPQALRFSLMGQATNLRRGRPPWGGDEGFIVEGIANDPETSSVDLVTTAGAGGVVRSLIETHYAEGHDGDDEILALLESVPDDRLSVWIRDKRPDLDLGGHRDVSGTAGSGSGDDNMTLAEALQTPEVQEYLDARVDTLVETRLTAEREEHDRKAAEEREDARLLRLGAHARSIIEAAKLPKASAELLLADWDAREGDDETVEAGAKLRLVEAVVEDGEVKKPARQVLAEKLDEDMKRVRGALAEAGPTVPWAPGGSRDGEGGTPPPGTFLGSGSGAAQRMRHSGLDPAKFGGLRPRQPATNGNG